MRSLRGITLKLETYGFGILGQIEFLFLSGRGGIRKKRRESGFEIGEKVEGALCPKMTRNT